MQGDENSKAWLPSMQTNTALLSSCPDCSKMPNKSNHCALENTTTACLDKLSRAQHKGQDNAG